MKNIIATATILLLIRGNLLAQYEQKLTLQFSSGASFIVSDYPLIEIENLDPNTNMIFEHSLSPGLMINGGVQYNFNRKFSLIGLIVYGQYNLDKSSPHFGYYWDPTTRQSHALEDLNYFNLGLGITAKYKFFPHKRFKPYLQYGLSGCFVKQEYFYSNLEPKVFEQPVLLGFNTGLGFEFDLTDNITIFLQGGYNKVTPMPDDGFPPTDSAYSLLGININVFKSRSL